jgi:hypothetical protein
MDQKEWTIMIYMAGDNNLAVDMAYALEQIKGVAGEGPDSPNLFVYYDGNSPSIPTLYCDFSEPNEPKYVRSFKVPDKLYDVPEKENENAAHRDSVINFVDWCVNKVEVRNGAEVTYGRRARRYALIFSGHSLGFQDIGLFRDETSGKAMKMTDFYYMLRRLVGTREQLEQDIAGWDIHGEERERETKVLLGQKLDILGFDSCVMGMLEVGYQFIDVANTMIASEGSVPNAGWTYAKLLGCLTRDQSGDGTARKVAEQFVRDFIKGQDSYTVGGVSVDMAAWDLSRITPVAAAFDGLSTALVECFEDPDSRIYRQMERVILQVHWKCQTYMYDQNVDLGDFCELLDRECGRVAEELGEGDDLDFLYNVQDCCRSVLEEIRQAVILSGFSGGGYQYSNGMSVFFPWSREGYQVSKENYQKLWFAKDSGSRKFYWNGFLKKYLNEVALRRFEPYTPDAAPGARYRYDSGIPFHESSALPVSSGNGSARIAGEQGSKIAGEMNSKIAGEEGSKIAGEMGSKIAGEVGSKIAGEQGSKIAGEVNSKIAGEQGSKIAGEVGSKIAGEQGSKIAGEVGSKIAGEQGSKIAGEQGSKIAGEEGSKLAGEIGSKLAGGGSSAFFNSLRLFKNVERRWNVSGFTKRESGPGSSPSAADD